VREYFVNMDGGVSVLIGESDLSLLSLEERGFHIFLYAR
jgi:hypothetical protein